ncbi:MAG TPA: DUF262 domain-containing HNH endonuclease family protein [Methanofastidiosum sp.]|nr:DUF262 domain-containing HNH endonuclease family protein [Methanofastidiosum sp.]
MVDSKDSKIKAEEILLANLFSENYVFQMPLYQRTFRWSKDNFEQLFEDITDAMESKEEQYFLGSIILQQLDSKNEYEIVDGQQRITSIIILMSVIRDKTNNVYLKESLSNSLYQKEDKFKGLKAKYRLTPWEELNDLFMEYVYKENGTNKFCELFEKKSIKYADEDDPTYHLYEAITIFREKVEKSNNIEDFVSYLLQNTNFVYIKTGSLVSAIRLFNVINARGESLTASDLLKSQNLGVILDQTERTRYAKMWRNIEESIGREELEKVIAFIRTIKTKEKAKISIYEEYENKIFKEKLLNKGPEFISYLNNISDVYNEKILEGKIETNSKEEKNKYRTLINLMNIYIPFADWIPPLLLFYHKYKDEDKILPFLLQLEKKVIVEWASKFTYTERITSLNRIIKLIDRSNSPEEVIAQILSFKEDDKKGKDAIFIDFLDKNAIINGLSILDDPQFYFKFGGKFAKYILLRLDIEKSELGNINKEYNGIISVEHILPQNPDNSGWKELFTGDERNEWTNKLGNLVLLSGRKNSKARNFEFQKKKDAYFRANEKMTDFIITREIDEYPVWNLNNLKKRHEDLKEEILKLYSS